MTITAAQCRAARALLKLSHTGLSGRSVVPVALIAGFEAGLGKPRPADLDALQRALEKAGVEFINDRVKLSREERNRRHIAARHRRSTLLR